MKYCILMVLVVCSVQVKAEEKQHVDPELLVGAWVLDMTPENKTDDNFATMRIDAIDGNSLQGMFYRDGVKIRKGVVNTQTKLIHVALVSGDNSGKYNSSFYYQGGILYGTTHAVGRDFLSVWTAEKVLD